MVPEHKKLKQRHNSRIDCNHLPLIEIPSAKTADNFEVSPFHWRSRGKPRRTKTRDWLNYLDFARRRTRNLSPKQH